MPCLLLLFVGQGQLVLTVVYPRTDLWPKPVSLFSAGLRIIMLYLLQKALVVPTSPLAPQTFWGGTTVPEGRAAPSLSTLAKNREREREARSAGEESRSLFLYPRERRERERDSPLKPGRRRERAQERAIFSVEVPCSCGSAESWIDVGVAFWLLVYSSYSVCRLGCSPFSLFSLRSSSFGFWAQSR